VEFTKLNVKSMKIHISKGFKRPYIPGAKISSLYVCFIGVLQRLYDFLLASLSKHVICSSGMIENDGSGVKLVSYSGATYFSLCFRPVHTAI
jgi:hypothetical protein